MFPNLSDTHSLETKAMSWMQIWFRQKPTLLINSWAPWLHRSQVAAARNARSATRAVRGWLLEVARQLLPILVPVSIASFVLYGLHPRLRNDPVALSLRECVFAQWRAIRSRKLHGHPAWTGSQIRSALNQRLERTIIYDYIHHPCIDICAKWRPYVTIGDDTHTINGLPTPSRGGGK